MWWRFEALAFPVMISVLMPSFPGYSSFGAWNPSIIYLISPSLGFRSSHAGGQPIGAAFHYSAPTTASPLSPSELPRDPLFWNCLTHFTLCISCVFPLCASFPVASCEQTGVISPTSAVPSQLPLRADFTCIISLDCHHKLPARLSFSSSTQGAKELVL